MNKVNLTRAFTLRKRLRTIVTEITEKLKGASTFILVSSTYPNNQVFKSGEKPFNYKGMDIQGAYNHLLTANKNIVTLNNIIDNANVPEARAVINEIEAEKNRVSVLNKFANDNKNFKESVSRFEKFVYDDVSKLQGGVVTETYKKVSSFDWEKEADLCRRKIVSLEDKLSDINSSTMVEIPDDIMDFIEKNI